MTRAPRLPKKPTTRDYRLRDVKWELRELADIMREARNGGRLDLSAPLGRVVRATDARFDAEE